MRRIPTDRAVWRRSAVWLLVAFVATGCSDSGRDSLPAMPAAGTSGPAAPAGGSPAAPAGAGGAGSLARAGASAAGGGGAAGAAPNGGAPAEPRAGAAGMLPAGGASGGAAGAAPGQAGAGTAGSSGSAAEPMVVCPATSLEPGIHDESVEHDGRSRTYVVHVPRSYTGDAPVPVVIDFHGFGSSGMGQIEASGFRRLGEEAGFVTVGPNGIGGSWHVNGCCGQAAQMQLDEIGFVRAMVAKLKESVCVDPKRIYASGISQGGGMAHHVGCLAADIFAAIAPVSSDLRTEPCEPSRPISELSVRGTADALSPYEGGPVGPPGMQYHSIGAEATLERWKMINGCMRMVETRVENCETYTQCAEGVEVTLCSVPGADHVLYGSFDVPKVAWEMFQRQPMP